MPGTAIVSLLGQISVGSVAATVGSIPEPIGLPDDVLMVADPRRGEKSMNANRILSAPQIVSRQN